jgi:hypothetical protein
MEQWFLGLRRSEERAVREEERKVLENELRSERQRMRAGLLMSVLGLFLIGSMGVVWEGRGLESHQIENLLAIALVALVPLLLYWVHHRQARMRALAKDLRKGIVIRFEGRLARESLFENENRKAHARLVEEGVLEGDPEVRQWVEMLPGTGKLLSSNGKLLRMRTVGEVREAAAPPEHPYVSALPTGYVVTLKYPELRSARRRMTEDELEELKLQIHRYRQPSLFALGSVVLFCVIILLMVESEGAVQLRLLPLLLLSAVGGIAYARRWYQSNQLQSDLAEGWLITIHDPAEEDEGMAGLPLNAPRAEVLPVSEGLWTERAKPAPWRFG